MVEERLGDPASSWSMGVQGALAEFMRRPGEPASLGPTSVVTPRGGIRVVLPDDVEVIAYEFPTGTGLHWNQAVAFCLDATAASQAARTAVTALGPDTDALRPRDQLLELFDLGLGIPTLDVCVRTTDAELRSALRGAAGGPLTPELTALLVERSPHRVFRTACGRLEVFTSIPEPSGRSPDGPHTHLRPDRLRRDRTHPVTAPIPDGLVAALVLHPPHPLVDTGGPDPSFDPERYAAFRQLLEKYGDPVAGALMATTFAAVRAGVGPDLTLLPRDPPALAAVDVALRQLAHIDGPSAALETWRARHPPDAGLLHPDG
jgi:hypothetical protein